MVCIFVLDSKRYVRRTVVVPGPSVLTETIGIQGKNSNIMFRKICLHHQAIKSIYLFSYNGCTLSYHPSISLNSK